MNLSAVTSVLSPKQITSIVESAKARMSIWAGAVRSGKTIASLLAFLIALAVAPDHGLVIIVGRTLQTIERNVVEPLQDRSLFGPLADQTHHTRGSTTAVILGRTVHLIGAADARAEGRLRGLTASWRTWMRRRSCRRGSGRSSWPACPLMRRWLALGIDYGTTSPLAAIVVGVGVDQRLYFTHEWRWDSKHRRRQLTDVEYSERLRAWLTGLPHPQSKVVGVRPQWTVVDPSAASFIAQLWQDGLSPAQGDNAVLDGIRTVASLLARDRLRVHRSCAGWINEVGGYSWDPDAAAKGEDKPLKVDDHSMDAGRYGVYTTQAAWRPELREAA